MLGIHCEVGKEEKRTLNTNGAANSENILSSLNNADTLLPHRILLLFSVSSDPIYCSDPVQSARNSSSCSWQSATISALSSMGRSPRPRGGGRGGGGSHRTLRVESIVSGVEVRRSRGVDGGEGDGGRAGVRVREMDRGVKTRL